MKNREGVLAIIFLCLIIFFVSDKVFVLYIASGVALASLSHHSLSQAIDRFYWLVIKTISKINSIILLSLIYFVLVVPIGLLIKARMTGQKKKNKSNFVDSEKHYTKEHLLNPW